MINPKVPTPKRHCNPRTVVFELYYTGATTLREVGAGIQCAPKMARILRSLGLLEVLRP